MPNVGEIRTGQNIGKDNYQRYIFAECPDCGKQRWVAGHSLGQSKGRCHSCSARRLFMEKAPFWKGGRCKSKDGYIRIKLSPDDFFIPMAGVKRYVLEHRLVVAKALSRCLLPWEVVHHKGTKYPSGSIENKSDNRYPENLQLLPSDKYHLVDKASKSYIRKLEKRLEQAEMRITLLEAENVLLKQPSEMKV